MTEFFSQPDDSGPARASDASTSLFGELGAEAANTLDPKDTLSFGYIARRVREGVAGGFVAHDYDGVGTAEQQMQLQGIDQAASAAIPDVSQDDAKAMLKQEGLTDQDVHLGDAPTHKLPVLQMQIDEAHTRRDRQAAIERGPQGFFPDALGLVTSIGVGMIDPVNAAAFSIPVIGEARMGKILASAGDSTNVDGRKVDIGKGTVGSEAEAKEYAERYLNNSAKEINQRRELEGQRVGSHRTLFGLDLHVGGEGMKGFYDNILPATVGKLVKKFGARVEPSTIGTPRESAHYEGPEPTKAQIAQVAEATSARPTDQRFVSPVTGARQMFQINRAAVEDSMRAVRQAMNGGASFAEAMARHGNHDLAEIFGGKLGQRASTETDAVLAVDITPELRKAAIEQGFPLFQGGEPSPRGRITLGENKAVIDLFKAADKSTFLHETGHLWLDELLRDAGREDAPEQLRGDRDAVLSWLGVKDAGEIGTAQHEKWAEGFEHYLATSEAPSSALAKAFEAFRQWLLDVYHAVTGLRQEVSPEIRGVMDRLLASDREIAERRAASEVSKPVTPAESEPEPEGVVTRHVTKVPRGRAAADPRTWSLFEYLASKGGLKPDPELRAIFGGKRGPMVGGFGPLLRHAGMTLDDALRSAKDGHYMFDPADVTGNEAHLTPRDLLDLLDQENRKHKVYRNDFQVPDKGLDLEQEAKHIRDALHSEIEATTGESGVHIDPELEARVVEIVQKEGVHDVMEAYERAIMEDGERYDAAAEARAADEQDHAIPGWDVPDDARAASARSGAAEALGGQAGSAEPGAGGSSGEQPRATRPGDRAPAQAKLKSSHAVVAADPRWRELADTTPDYSDPEVLAESEEAARTPEPASVDPKKSLSALEKAAADAEEVWRQLEPTLTEDERKAVNDAFANLQVEKVTRDRMIADGVTCLMGAIG